MGSPLVWLWSKVANFVEQRTLPNVKPHQCFGFFLWWWQKCSNKFFLRNYPKSIHPTYLKFVWKIEIIMNELGNTCTFLCTFMALPLNSHFFLFWNNNTKTQFDLALPPPSPKPKGTPHFQVCCVVSWVLEVNSIECRRRERRLLHTGHSHKRKRHYTSFPDFFNLSSWNIDVMAEALAIICTTWVKENIRNIRWSNNRNTVMISWSCHGKG